MAEKVPERVRAPGVASKSRGRDRLRLAVQRLGGKRLLGVEVRSDADFLKAGKGRSDRGALRTGPPGSAVARGS